ncbi:hydrolase [Actinacidiphila alni]|uniref:alpha/beta hydrolase family protein n=1 Tax=Actinacidiphila alni TaxID=380248 RepID=UPI0033C9A66D
MLTRRTAVLSTAAAAAVSLTATGTARAAQAQAQPVRFRLPAPTGPYPVGTVALRLVDASRHDPWLPHLPYRELMIGVRYPARTVVGHPAAPQMLPGEAAGFAELNSLGGVPAGRVDWAATRTHAYEGAPVLMRGGPHPVILYSPGAGDPRTMNTTLCDDLASRGFVVVTLDHTYDAGAVEFPGGRVEKSVLPAEFAKVADDPAGLTALLRKTLAVRVADTRFLLDALPGALPPALRAAADLRRTGMFGHSAGGFTALQAMHEDARIRAGIDIDGVLAYVQEGNIPGEFSDVAASGLDRPFLLVGKDHDDLRSELAWAALWRRSTGWHRGFSFCGAEHASFTDAEAIVPQLARPLGLSRATVTALVGTLPPALAVPAQRSYVAAFFTRFLRSRGDGGLLDSPSPRYPYVHFFPAECGT